MDKGITQLALTHAASEGNQRILPAQEAADMLAAAMVKIPSVTPGKRLLAATPMVEQNPP